MEQPEIRNMLQTIRQLLEHYGEKQWSVEIAYLEEFLGRAYATASDDRKREALDHIGRLFGGMGSFNDFRFSRTAGDNILLSEQADANRELHRLKNQLYRAVVEEREKLGPAH